MRAAHGGDPADRLAAFGEIVARFQDMACGYAYAVLGDFHLAEDAAQEAFVSAYRRLHDLRDPDAFPGWLRRIVQTACGRMTRRRQIPATSLEAASHVPADEVEPVGLLEKVEMRDQVLAAVRALPEPQREVTTLFYINGYSQQDVADFLEVPVTTVNNRLHASRRRLKQRMLKMVEDRLHQNAPDERFSQKVIAALLARPRPLEIEGHPVRQIWDRIHAALPDYEVVTGDEVEDKALLEAVHENMDRAYHVSDRTALRTQMTVTTLKAVRGRPAPVRLIAAGRVFRPEQEDATRLSVFHQADGICIETGADMDALQATCRRVIEAAVGTAEVRWEPCDFGFVDSGIEGAVRVNDQWLRVSGAGLLEAQTLREAGHDPATVTGYAFGVGLERLAMLVLGLDDVRALWRPPYVPE